MKASWHFPLTGHGKAHMFLFSEDGRQMRTLCKIMSYTRTYIPEQCTKRRRGKHCTVCERRSRGRK